MTGICSRATWVFALLVSVGCLAGTPKKKAAPKVSVLFAGDVTLGYHYEEYFDEQVAKGRTREEMFAHGFERVRSTAETADFFIVNLECPFTDRGEKIPKNFNFRARPELIASLLAGSVDVVSLANNHLMDYGFEGLLDTTEALDQAKILHFGAGRSLSDARKPVVIEKNGVKIALLGYFFLGERNIEPAEVIATDSTPGVAGHASDVEQMEKMLEEDLALAKSMAAVVVPFFHWGREGTRQPEEYQVRLAHKAIDLGAAAVIGSHPHVLQGMELYKGAPILYSLGNFVFGGNWDPKDKRTAMVELTFTSTGVASTRVLPAKSDRYPDVPVQPYLVSGPEGEEVLRHLATLSAEFEATLPQLKRYAK